jgi:signal transduction histidine kinase/ligand-binding sensor domain-containing protein
MRLGALIAASVLWNRSALALDPALQINQYGHTAWTARDSSLKGYPRAITQTRDGFLWLATEFGVLRFDGVRLVSWPDATLASQLGADVTTVMAASDGALWIATTRGLARARDGALSPVRELAGRYVSTLVEDRAGVVWAGTSAGLTGRAEVCAIRGAAVTCQGGDGVLGRFVSGLHADPQGRLWVGAATGLWRWRSEGPVRSALPVGTSEIHSIVDEGEHTLLLALNRGLHRVREDAIESRPIAETAGVKATASLRDRDGALWIGTQDRGLMHLSGGRVDWFTTSDGLSGDFVTDIFEDREGNVWVATLNGLDRFRSYAVTTISRKQGLSASGVVSVLAAPDGAVWIGTVNGLNRWQDGAVVRAPDTTPSSAGSVASLLRDTMGQLWVSSPRGLAILTGDRLAAVTGFPPGYVHAMAEDRAQTVWISEQEQGLFQLRDRRIVKHIPWATLGGRVARAIAPDPAQDGVWVGFFDGGVARLASDGSVKATYGAADGLGGGQVSNMFSDHAGALWIATRGGLSRLGAGESRVRTLTMKSGLPCDAVHWAIEDDRRALWLNTACGLVRIERSQVDAWVRGEAGAISVVVYDDRDGVQTRSTAGSYGPPVTRASDGRLWFTAYGGAAVVDPARATRSELPAPIHIEQVTADDKTYAPGSTMKLPPLVRNVRIDYTALSLAVPERVRFRYKLEGHDAEWTDAGQRREAFYTDLPPRAYRFRVVATNSDGVWNQDGAALAFSVAPALYQTRAFLAGCSLLAITAVWTLYRLHLKRIAAQLNARFEERLQERARIGQDLHDTLFQGFISTSMQLDVVVEQVPEPHLRAQFDRILQRMRHVIDEGRDAVQNLHERPPLDDLEHSLARAAEELRGPLPVKIDILGGGPRRPLQPLIRDEVYRIGREALANVFRHANATRVDVEIEYGSDYFRMTIRDDGRGMDASVASSGHPGHLGTSGMRQRAERVGATLTFWSRAHAGTQVELTVPGHVAFSSYE